MELTRSQIDQAGQSFRDFQETPRDRRIVQEYRRFRCQGLEELFQDIARTIHGHPCVPSCRIKRVDTIIRKLIRESAMDLSRMDDVIGFRLIVPSMEVQQQVTRSLGIGLHLRRIRDYTSRPTGYRAVHAIIGQSLSLAGSSQSQTFPCEVQIRTFFQQLWATASESFGEQVKEGGGTAAQKEYLQLLAQSIHECEAENPAAQQIEQLQTIVQAAFMVVVFDKKKGTRILHEFFGEDLKTAISRVLNLEEMYQQDFSRETVLLGVPTGAEAQITHMRYFRPGGIPDIPDFLRPAKPRPR